MVCKSIHALADGLSLHDAASFSGHDWSLIEAAVAQARQAKIETPDDIIPMVTLIGTIWDGWDRMRRAIVTWLYPWLRPSPLICRRHLVA